MNPVHLRFTSTGFKPEPDKVSLIACAWMALIWQTLMNNSTCLVKELSRLD